jgi:predicted kinase
MKERKVFILCGQAFSGKSTLSKQLADIYKAKIIGRDEIYFSIEKLLAFENTPEDDDDALWENLWPLVTQGLKNNLLLGNSVIIDDNCLRLQQRDELRSIAREASVKNTLIYFDVPSEILRARKEENKKTKLRHDVPSAWLDDDAKIFERPTEDEEPIIFEPSIALDDLIDIIRARE